MSAHPLPLLPYEQDGRLNEEELEGDVWPEEVRLLEGREQTNLEEEHYLDLALLKSALNDGFVESPSIPIASHSKAHDRIRLKDFRRKPLPHNDSYVPPSSALSANHDQLSQNCISLDEHAKAASAAGLHYAHFAEEDEQARSRRSKPTTQSHPPASPHVRFASPLHLSTPHTPSSSPFSYDRSRAKHQHGPRQPPWGSSDDLALQRRLRMEIRSHDDTLSKRFKEESHQLEQRRRLSAEEIRAGKRKTEVDELRELVCEVYPDMVFEGEEGSGRWCCCCVVM